MVKSYQISKPGDIKTLKLKKNKLADPGPGEVRVKNHFVGVNHMDVHFRNGTYALGKYPFTPGISGAGEIVKVGDRVKDFKVGEKVAYGTNFLGSYSEEINIRANYIVGVDSAVTLEQAAACIVPGLTSHYLIYNTYQVKKGNYVLVTGATGSVGHILCQWLTSLGADVTGVVGNDAKATQAKNFGCKHVLNYKNKDFLDRAMEITRKSGYNVSYDAIGNAIFDQHMDVLSILGLLVNYGDTSGIIDKFDPMKLMPKGLFYTKPNLTLYKANRMELVLSAQVVFDNIKNKVIRPIYETVDFGKIAEAHAKIESAKTVGSVVARL